MLTTLTMLTTLHVLTTLLTTFLHDLPQPRRLWQTTTFLPLLPTLLVESFAAEVREWAADARRGGVGSGRASI